jgi:hypothetical protein
VQTLVNAVVTDAKRDSRKLSKTDALGRPRVQRKRAGKGAVMA